MATAIFRFDRSNSLQAIWPVAGQVVTALNIQKSNRKLLA